MPYGKNWKSVLNILQPSPRCLEIVKHRLGRRATALPNNVEIALDIIPLQNIQNQIENLESAFLESAIPLWTRSPIKVYEKTIYFGSRSGTSQRKAGRLLVMYSDKHSKLNPRDDNPLRTPCLHMEFRIFGTPSLERIGLFSINEMIEFDHLEFWKNQVKLYRLPNLTKTGGLVGAMKGMSKDVSSRALRKRATSWIKEHTVQTTLGQNFFVLHNAVLGCDRRLMEPHRITFKNLISQAVAKASLAPRSAN
jgi:hypothetical protein